MSRPARGIFLAHRFQMIPRCLSTAFPKANDQISRQVPDNFPWDRTPASLSGARPKFADRIICDTLVLGLIAGERYERWEDCEDPAQQLVAVAYKDAANCPEHSQDVTLQRAMRRCRQKMG